MERKTFAVEGWQLETPAYLSASANAAESVLPFGVWDRRGGRLLCACDDEATAHWIADVLEDALLAGEAA